MRTLSGVIMAGLILALAGCGDDDAKAGGAASSAAPSVSASAPTPPPPPSATATNSPSASASSATTPAQTTPAPDSSAPPSTAGGTAPKTTQGAIARYEEFLHATGREDLDTMCEISSFAAKKAEEEGFGACRSAYTYVLQELISPEQKAALRTATVDPGKITVQGPARVDIPAAAVKASVTFAEDELGTSTLEYIDGNWYVTD
ncbi:hypothetical protein LO772_00755 [Yinghuangia sp. ASG 101]|uniref:hypothetical protein n=1 Tax=Yinghuangia sp. ASG 101 TaxID=2896848 RepID=UPI001E2B3802|nr:hypothetical protein [Yinghuangia sp. ASG 101]UGQ12174.1 hypothetical protein LO772_00755 [Yinghuangia sp. ASG 101]